MDDNQVFEYDLESPPSRSSVDPTPDTSSLTLLDRLKMEVQRKVERPVVFLEVPERPGVKILVSPNITQEQMKAWRKNSGEASRNGFDAIKFACYVVGACTRGIYMGDEEVLSEGGAPLSFASQEILDMTETTRPIPDCVRAMFGLDPHVESAAMAILQAAGYDDDVDVEDPTKTSSEN